MIKGYFLEDYVILGDELLVMLENNDYLNTEMVQNYILKEKTKFMFGCTTKLFKYFKK